MLLKTYPLGDLQTNCYLLCDDSGHAVIVDPAENGDELADLLEEQGLHLDAICLTHVHFDHIGGLSKLCERTGAPVYLHPEELSIADALSRGRLRVPTQAYPTVLKAGDLEITVHHTPGHSPGSVCLQAEDKLFSGDTLFAGTCGRIDLLGGSWEQMRASLRYLYHLEGNLSVYPGHGPSSTLDTERDCNPYMQEAKR